MAYLLSELFSRGLTDKDGLHVDLLLPRRVEEGLATLEEAVRHAPKGGISLGGKKYTGGEFIPDEAWNKLSAADKTKYQQAKKAARGSKTQPQGKEKPRHAPIPRTDQQAFLQKGKWLKLQSDVLRSAHFDAEGKQLWLQFKDGSAYVYAGVTSQEAEDFLNAPSHGRWFNQHLRNFDPVTGEKKKFLKVAEKVSGILDTIGERWQHADATKLEVILAEVLGGQHWGERYPADLTLPVKLEKDGTVLYGIDTKATIQSKDGGYSQDHVSNRAKVMYAAGMSSQSEKPAIVSFIGGNVNGIPGHSLLHFKENLGGGSYAGMEPIEVPGMKTMDDLRKPEVAQQLKKAILARLKTVDPAKYTKKVDDMAARQEVQSLKDAGRMRQAREKLGADPGKIDEKVSKALDVVKVEDRYKKQIKKKNDTIKLMRKALQGDEEAKAELQARGLL